MAWEASKYDSVLVPVLPAYLVPAGDAAAHAEGAAAGGAGHGFVIGDVMLLGLDQED